MSEPLFDSKRFLQSLADDVELANELLAAFLEDSPTRVASLSEALDSDDAAKASKLAHSLKGMCGVVRTDSLVNIALLMESSSKNGDLDTTKNQFATFKETLDSAHEEMRQFMNG